MRALLLAALSTFLACGDPPPPSDGQVEGAKLATSLVQQLNSSLQLSAPFRCARVQVNLATPRVNGMSTSMTGATVQFEELAKKKSLRFGAISDARGSEEETLAAVSTLRESFVTEKVDLVLSLGGHGSSLASIQAVLSALTLDAPYLTIAIPGDRESVSAHREAVRELAKSGAKIIDGARYRVLSFGKVVVATMPGISKQANLIEGDNGCLHTVADVNQLLRYLPADTSLLLASYAPPRQEGPEGSDIGAGGIHTGEAALAGLLQNKALSLVVHGMVDNATPSSGKLKLGQGMRSVATGSADPLEGRTSALVISITGKKLAWKRLRADR